MTTPLEQFAQRLEEDPYFLAAPLKWYAQSERLDDRGLAETLGCSSEVLLRLRLCRAPASDFQHDVAAIAGRFDVQQDLLANMIRRGQAIIAMRAEAIVAEQGYLMAARDAEINLDQEGNS